MARGSKKWLDQLIDKLSTRFNTSKENWTGLSLLNNGARGQRTVFSEYNSADKLAILEAVLELAGFQPSEDQTTNKFHNALLDYHANAINHSLPDLFKWSKMYHKSPHFIGAPENRIPLDQIIKTKKGTIRNPVHSLYRLLRGNAKLNESKDFISLLPSIYDAQVTTALNKLSKQGYVKHDPKSGFTLIPRDIIRQIDPYYERYHETLNALKQASSEDYAELYHASRAEDESGELTPEIKQARAKYTPLAKAFIQDQLRRNMPRIAEDIPLEERNRLFAAQQDRLQNLSNRDIEDGIIALYNRSFKAQRADSWPINQANAVMRLASMFSEKGLRGLLNNPKRALKLAQINELLEDKWDEINDREGRYHWRPPQNDPLISRDMFYAIPYGAVDSNVHEPAGPWKEGDLQSLNNYDAFRRQLEDRKRTIARNKTQARERVLQYIAAHPELQQIAERNNADRQRRLQLQNMRGIGYTPNAEDQEEEQIINGLGRQLRGNYSEIAKTLLNQPRLVELAERPYQYSKGLLASVNDAGTPWQLAKNRRDLYDRSLYHNICIGMPLMEYHDKALAKKSLLFFSGEHTDPESEAGEIALYIDPKTHKIIKTDVVQVHGIHNAPGSELGTQNLKYIADALVGKSIDDTDNAIEDAGIAYTDEQEGEFDEDDEGYAEGGFVEPTANPAYRRLLELLLEDGMTKPSRHVQSLLTRRF
jgi:hypothetical protein